MKKNTNYYYIASPGWSDQDKEGISFIENTLKDQHMEFFSPFTDGGMLKLYEDPEKSKVSVKVMFDENISQIEQATDMIARTDGFDKGTFFEIGYFIGLNLDTYRRHLLLIGENSTEASKLIENAVEIFRNEYILKIYNENIEPSPVYIDITEKSIDKYILLGMLYACGYEVISTSKEELSSNIMTACSVIGHIVNHGELVTLNLSAFKSSKSMK